jgi:hypothetical protein
MAVDLECEVLEHVEREVVAAIRFEAQHDEITPSSRVLGIGHPAHDIGIWQGQ